ncbi:unnamed protein product, partial [Mesorhabditis belari]|uniref:Calpain catalytic domain-containing protein n=1 Tax=Mesorhabditis belari TaxID=2138241 RepID=A0AAF3EDT3_9BILA
MITCYEWLDGRVPTDELEDFTAGLTEHFDLRKTDKNTLMAMIVRGFQMGSFFCASINADPNSFENQLSNEAMSGTVSPRIEVAPWGCEESVQLRHKSDSQQEQPQCLTDFVGKDENGGDHMSLMEQNEALGQKNDHLEADKEKLRLAEILKGSHQLHTDMMNPLIDSSEPFGKDEPTGKKWEC